MADNNNRRQHPIELRPLITNHDSLSVQQDTDRRAQSLPLPNEMVRSPTFGNSLLNPLQLKQCPCAIDPASLKQLNKTCSKECIRLCVLKHPDYVRWHVPEERVNIHKDARGKLGFRTTLVQSTRNTDEKYTLVHSVNEGSDAVGKLVFGDSILSVDGTPLKNKTLAEIVKVSNQNVVSIIKNRPMGLIPMHRHNMQRSTSYPSPGQTRRITTPDESSDSYNSLDSENTPLTRVGSRNSGTSSSSRSSNSYAPGSPVSPGVNINIHVISPENGAASQPSSLPNMPVWNEEPSNVALNGDNVPEMNRHQLAAVEGEVSKVLAADMPLLPHLKLVIIGSKSDQFAESLLSGDISPKSEDVVCKKYKTYLVKKEQTCEWLPSHGRKTIQPIMKAVTNAVRDSLGIDLTTSTLSASHASEQCGLILNHIGQNGFTSESNMEEVELEVLAVKDSPLSTYCRHVLYTAHSIYMVQFDISDYYENRDSVLTFIQMELSKIRTYASDKVQIMLVATASNPLPSRDMNHIGQTLQEYFRGAFTNQLHPNAENNLPCHFVFPGNQVNGLSSQLNNLSCFDRQESCEDNTAPQHTTNSVPNGDSHMDYVPHRMRAGHINGEDQTQSDADGGPEKHYNVYDLKSQISTMAFQQRFAPRKYPYRYLLYQDQKENVRYSHPVGALQSDILRECHIEDEAEKNAVLKYLHDSGDIICMNNLPYMMSHNLHLLNFMDMVLFSRDHLIDAIQKLLTIPPLPSQVPAHRMHWAELENMAQIRRSFLLDLLGADHRLLEIFLEMMNLIFCMDDGLTNQQRNVNEEYVPHRRRGDEDNAAEIQNGTTSAQYLVPFYLAKQHRNVEDSAPRRSNGDRILYLDFRGFIPHGAFTRVMIQLIGVSEEERGSWEIGSQCSGWVTFGKHAKDFDCRLEMELDQLGATIKISALCSMSYSPQNIPTLLRQRIMKRLKPKDNIIAYKCGPPCPRIPHCQHGQTRVHVLDLRDGRGPLWCGQEQVDREQSVNQWLLEGAVVQDLPPADDSTEVTVVRSSSHIRHLPPSLYTWICNQLNVGYATGQNWETLADELGYQMSDILVWRERRQRVTDPCDSFLQDWGRRQSATLDKLIQCLNHMRREDMLEDMRYQWDIVN